MRLDLRTTLAEIRKNYKEDKSQEGFNLLLLGEEGVGKTYLTRTMRKPVLIHSFDPGGTKNLKKEIAEGSIIVDSRFEHEDISKSKTILTRTHVFRDWEREFERLESGGVFGQLGTYVIDSFSTMLIFLRMEVARRFKREDSALQLQDHGVVNSTMRDYFLKLLTLECDVVVMGHLESEKDEVSGRIHNKLDGPRGLQSLLPKIFDEIYVMQAKESAKGIERSLLTVNNGKYRARTRIGAGKFDSVEQLTDIGLKGLLRKAGLPTNDLDY